MKDLGPVWGPRAARRASDTTRRGQALTWRSGSTRARRRISQRAFAALLAPKREVSEDVDAGVRAIIEDVVARGDEALIAYTRASTAST